MSGCPDSLTGVRTLSEPGAELRSGHPWRSHERRCLYVLAASWRQTGTRSRCQPWRCRSSCPPSFTSGLSKDTLPLHCGSLVRVQQAPRVRGSTLAKHPHSTTAPCITGRIKPFMHDCICATAIYLQFLAHFVFPFFLF